MTPLTIYLWRQADSIDCLFTWLSVPFYVLGFWGLWEAVVGDREEFKNTLKLALSFLSAALSLSVLAVATPSSKTIAMMVAIPAITNSEPIQKDLPELYQLAKEALKEQIANEATQPAK